MVPASPFLLNLQAVFDHERTALWHQRSILAVALGLVMLVALFFVMAHAHQRASVETTLSFVWIVLVLYMGMILQLHREEYCNGWMQQWVVAGIPMVGIAAVKMVQLWVMEVLAILPLGMVLISTDQGSYPMLANILLMSPLMASIMYLGMLLTLPHPGKTNPMLLFVLPWLIPLFLLSLTEASSRVAGGASGVSLWLIAGVVCMLTPVIFWASVGCMHCMLVRRLMVDGDAW